MSRNNCFSRIRLLMNVKNLFTLLSIFILTSCVYPRWDKSLSNQFWANNQQKVTILVDIDRPVDKIGIDINTPKEVIDAAITRQMIINKINHSSWYSHWNRKIVNDFAQVFKKRQMNNIVIYPYKINKLLDHGAVVNYTLLDTIAKKTHSNKFLIIFFYQPVITEEQNYPFLTSALPVPAGKMKVEVRLSGIFIDAKNREILWDRIYIFGEDHIQGDWKQPSNVINALTNATLIAEDKLINDFLRK